MLFEEITRSSRISKIKRKREQSKKKETAKRDRRSEWDLDDYEPEEVTLAPQLIGEYQQRYLVLREKRLHQEQSHLLDKRISHGTFL